MTDTLFKEVHYTLGNLIGDIGLGRIGLPDIQRPFVWSNAKVRDLFDSMYRGYADFLTARRPLIAGVIRAGYEKLAAQSTGSAAAA